MNSNQSEVARIKEQIIREYQAAQQVFGGFTSTAKHEYLTKRQENLGMHFEELKKHMSPEEAMQIFMQVEKKGNGNPTITPDSSLNLFRVTLLSSEPEWM